MMKFLSAHRYLFSLFGIVLLVCIANYTPGTWLTGWDNLHPEFNFSLNIYRSFFSVWEEYQGTGLLAGMGHAADLPRQILLWITSMIIPMQFSRYFFHFLMLFVGTSGVYYFIRHIFMQTTTNYELRTTNSLAFLGALFYLFNLGTVQYFFVPFEPYSMFWGMLPWELYVAIRFLKTPSKRNLLFLALINLAATAQGYVQTVFFVYVLVIVLLLGSFWLYEKTAAALKHAFVILAVIFCVNAFWVLPNLYFTIHDVQVTQNAMNNRQNTQRFFEQNKLHGTISDFAVLKEFYLDFYEPLAGTEQYDYMMRSWRSHFANPLIALIGYSFFLLILLGIFSPFLQRNNRTIEQSNNEEINGKWQMINGKSLQLFFLLLFLLSMIIFLSDTFIFAQINALFRSLPLVNQIFRNPFTKFIVPVIFIFSIGFSLGCALLFQYLSRPSLRFQKYLFYFLTALILLTALPAFRGEFIARQMRINIPTEYFQLFDYFKTQDKNARIMNLPQGSYWGWGSYSWGSIGSGFLWYGIEQPIMDRAFDVWSGELEDYYWQLWYALKKKDTALFNEILEKYAIRYIIFDTSYTPSDANPIKTLYLQQNDLLKKNPKVTLVKTFGTIKVYKTKLSYTSKDTILAKTNLPTVSGREPFSNQDMAFAKLGFYQNAAGGTTPDVVFPFGSLFTGRFQKEAAFCAKNTPTAITLSTITPPGTYLLSYPAEQAQQTINPILIEAKKDQAGVRLRFLAAQPTLSFDHREIPSVPIPTEVTIPLPGRTEKVILSINNQDFFSLTPTADFRLIGSTYFINQDQANTIRVYDGSTPTTVPLPAKDFGQGLECEPIPEAMAFSADRKTDTLILAAQKTNVCSIYTKPIPPLLTNSLVAVSFDYASSSDEKPQYCFSTTDGQGCLNLKKGTMLPGFAQHGHVSDFFILGEITENPTLQFRLNASENDEKKQLALRHISLTSYPVLGSIVGDIPTTASAAARFIRVSAPKAATLQVAIPKLDNERVYQNLLEQQLYAQQASQPKTLPNIGNVYLREIAQHPKTLRLSATNTYAQFWLTIPQNHLNTGYIMFLDTRNIAGFPLTLNIYTPDDRNKYLYTMAENKKDWTTMSYVLPPQYPFDPGMEILLMSNSVNNEPSTNDIRNVSLYPIPYDYITDIMLQNTDWQPKPEVDVTKQLSVSKNSLAQYTVIAENLPADTTLILMQGYHEGWVAYRVQSSWFGVQSWFPFFGEEIKNHIRVNNWANGWNIPYALDARPYTLVIIFWPQYLQFLGFLLLPLPFLGLLWYRNRS